MASINAVKYPDGGRGHSKRSPLIRRAEAGELFQMFFCLFVFLHDCTSWYSKPVYVFFCLKSPRASLMSTFLDSKTFSWAWTWTWIESHSSGTIDEPHVKVVCLGWMMEPLNAFVYVTWICTRVRPSCTVLMLYDPLCLKQGGAGYSRMFAICSVFVWFEVL